MLAAGYGRPSFMDSDSPGASAMDCGSSTGGTPYSTKRLRDEELDAILNAGPPAKRMETTPCHTPVTSPGNEGPARMCTSTPLCTTPLSGYPTAALQRAGELGVRWGSASSIGPRR